MGDVFMNDLKKIKLLVMDVDGTMTDGKIYISDNGEAMKAFNSKDGYGLSVILPPTGIKTAIITGRTSDIVKWRANELGISEIYQGIKDKPAALEDLLKKLGLTYENVAYIGDDLNDLECMKLSAVSACPADSVEEVKEVADLVCKSNGGNGAVREFINLLSFSREKESKQRKSASVG